VDNFSTSPVEKCLFDCLPCGYVDILWVSYPRIVDKLPDTEIEMKKEQDELDSIITISFRAMWICG
jgi:hypothetical protein